MEQTEAGARSIGVRLLKVPVTQAGDLDQAFAEAAQQTVGGMIVFTHGFAEFYRQRIIEAAARHQVYIYF